MAMKCSGCNHSPSPLRCSVCKSVYYCGASCQSRSWKEHKLICSVPSTTNLTELEHLFDVLADYPSDDNVRNAVLDASMKRDWKTVLKWKARVTDVLRGESQASQERILHCYQFAFEQRHSATGVVKDVDFISSLMVQRSKLLQNMFHFLDQAKCICLHAEQRYRSDNFANALELFLQAGKVAEEHGFISIESRVCVGLGKLASKGVDVRQKPWRLDNTSCQSMTAVMYHSCRSSAAVHSEAVALFHNGVRAARLAEAAFQQPELELNALYALSKELFDYGGECGCAQCVSFPSSPAIARDIETVVSCYLMWIQKMEEAQAQHGWVAREHRYDKHIVLEEPLRNNRVLTSRTRIDFSAPSLIMTRLHVIHIKAMHAVTMGLPDDACLLLHSLLEYVGKIQATRHMSHEFFNVLRVVNTPRLECAP